MGLDYGFPVWEIYDTIPELLNWFGNAARTAVEVAEQYLEEAWEYLQEIAQDVMEAMSEILSDLADYFHIALLDLLEFANDVLADPIVIDLDGDGIVLTALASSTTIFDLDGDGFAERTGWVSPQDGLLVHDADGDNIVDGVAELFGSANVDGYDELATLDANGDGRIDATDPAFFELRVWRDTNRDGISSADEMLTLTQAEIVGFNLSYAQTDTEVDGNVIARTGTYLRSDGSNRTMVSVQFAMDESGSFPIIPQGADLANLPVLPNLSGLLGLPDLRAAMYVDSTLKTMVEDLVFGSHDFDTFAEFRNGGFENVLYRWAGVETSIPVGPDEHSHQIQVLAAFIGRPFGELTPHQLETLEAAWPELVKQMGVLFLFQAAQNPALEPLLALARQVTQLDVNSSTYLDQIATLTETALADAAAVTPAYDYLERFVGLSLDPASGEMIGDFDAFVRAFLSDQPSFFAEFASPGGGGSVSLSSVEGEIRHPWTAWYEDQGSLLFTVAGAMGIAPDYVLNVTGWRWLAGGMSRHYGSAGTDLLDFDVTYYQLDINGPPNETHDQLLFGYGGDDELRGNDGVDRLVGGTGNDLLQGGSDSDMYVYASGDGLDQIIDASGSADTIYFSSELNRADLRVTRLTGTNDLLLYFGDPSQGIVLTNQWSSSGAAIEQVHFVAEDAADPGDLASLYLATVATDGADTIVGSWASERLIGLAGDDTLSGADGSDTIDAGAGADLLDGGDGNDILVGGDGADTLLGELGDDQLRGGSGDDLLRGGAGDDVYTFGIGDGDDAIDDSIAVGNRGGTDTVEFGPGIDPADVAVLQSGNDLILTIAGAGDRVTLRGTMDNQGDSERIERVVFADGTIWLHAHLFALATAPTSGNDSFIGGPEDEGLAGGAGDDTLIGNHGNDSLDGGSGIDMLRGGKDDDTYVFGRGYGQDTVADNIVVDNRGGSDTVLLAADLLPADISVVQADGGRDLVIRINGTSDQLTLDNTITDGHARIERLVFADGTVWTYEHMLALTTGGTPGDDSISGDSSANFLAGGAGNDTLTGNGGDDRLDGGTGTDVLKGGAGNDTYVFDLGYGLDRIADNIAVGNRGGFDTVELGVGLLPSGIGVTQATGGSDLVVRILGTSDQLTLDNTVSDGNARVEQLVFADGTVWTYEYMLALATTATAGDDVFYGDASSNILAGGSGNDTLTGNLGDDSLEGGTGNDLLRGGAGNDTYIFNLGDGADIVRDNIATGNRGGADTLRVDVLPWEIEIVQADSGRDLIVRILGTTDQITLDNTISDTNARIEQLVFADNSTWTYADMLAASQSGGGGAAALLVGPNNPAFFF